MAQAHDFIESLSDGYHTLIGEEGELLSGGQRQRLSIARALLCDSEIVIFDEATSQMDALTEEAMRVLIDNFHRKKTIISIAHRLSTIINADKIFVFSDGNLVQSGKHKILKNRPGLYQKMVEVQFSDRNPISSD